MEMIEKKRAQNANGASWKIKLFPYPVGKIAIASFLLKKCIKHFYWQFFSGFTNQVSFSTLDSIFTTESKRSVEYLIKYLQSNYQ
jgi:hypothetical protein